MESYAEDLVAKPFLETGFPRRLIKRELSPQVHILEAVHAGTLFGLVISWRPCTPVRSLDWSFLGGRARRYALWIGHILEAVHAGTLFGLVISWRPCTPVRSLDWSYLGGRARRYALWIGHILEAVHAGTLFGLVISWRPCTPVRSLDWSYLGGRARRYAPWIGQVRHPGTGGLTQSFRRDATHVQEHPHHLRRHRFVHASVRQRTRPTDATETCGRGEVSRRPDAARHAAAEVAPDSSSIMSTRSSRTIRIRVSLSPARREGDADPDKTITADTMKLLGNWGYRKTVANLDLPRDFTYCSMTGASNLINNRRFRQLDAVVDEVDEVEL